MTTDRLNEDSVEIVDEDAFAEAQADAERAEAEQVTDEDIEAEVKELDAVAAVAMAERDPDAVRQWQAQLKAKAKAEREWAAAEQLASARKTSATLKAAAESIRAEAPTFALPTRTEIERALLLLPASDYDLVHRLRQGAKDGSLAGNTLAPIGPGMMPLVSAAHAEGRLVVMVERDNGTRSPGHVVAIPPTKLLEWQVESGASVYVIEDRHAVWVSKLARRRTGTYELPAEDRFMEGYERQWDADLWKAAEGIAMWIRQGHVEQHTADHARDVLKARREAAQQAVVKAWQEHRIAQTEGVGGYPVFFAPGTMKNPDPSWLVAGQLPRASVVGLFGPPSGGKSKTATSLASAVSTGSDWCGMKVNGGKPGQVVYLALERLAAVDADIVANTPPELLGVMREHLRMSGTFPAVFDRDGFRTRHYDTAAQWLQGASLIVLDWSAYLAANGADSVNGADRIMSEWARLAARTGATVLLISHSRKGDAADDLGSALRKAADAMVPVSREGGGEGELVVRFGRASRGHKTQHRAPATTDLLLTFREIDGDPTFPEIDGKPMRLVGHQEVAPLGEGGARAKGRRPVAATKVLDTLRQLGKPAGMAEIVEGTRLNRSTCSTTLRKLVKDGDVRMEEEGRLRFWSLSLSRSPSPS